MKLSKEAKAGLLATAALAIVYLGFNFLKGSEVFSTTNTYHTIYENCQGLGTASPVLLNGMPVGRVRNIKILPNKKHSVLVTFETMKEIRLTDTTKARLVSPSLLGGKAIDLFIEEGNLLKNYDTVPGQVEPGFGDIFADSTLSSLQDVKDISTLVSQFVAYLIENTDKINSIFANLEETTKQLRQTIAKNHQEFDTMSRNMSEVSNALADSKDGVRPFLTKLNLLMEGIKAKELAANLNHALSSVGKVLDETGQGKNSLGKLLYDDSLYNNLYQTLGNLDELLIDLKTHPWRYVSFSVFGKKQGFKKVKTE